MNTIGQRIKELRKANDMTQEKLAEFLGVTDKAVSKWECGMTTPDLGLILPLARLLHISADELLGGRTAEEEARRAELDERCEHYWKYDTVETYRMAVQAVSEYPGDYRYLVWLARMEYFSAYEKEFCPNPDQRWSPEMMESVLRHCDTVIEGCTDPVLREQAIWLAMICCRYTERLNEAMHYAEMFPEKKPITRDQAMEVCLEGEPLAAHLQKASRSALNDFCMSLMTMYRFAEQKDETVMAALDAEEAVLGAIFPDGEALDFYWELSAIYEKRVQLEIREGNVDRAMEYLCIRMEHVRKYDALLKSKDQRYTSKIFSRLIINPVQDDPAGVRVRFNEGESFGETVKEELLTESVYAPLREMAEFTELLK